MQCISIALSALISCKQYRLCLQSIQGVVIRVICITEGQYTLAVAWSKTIPAKLEVRSFTVPGIIAGTQKNWSISAHAPFSPKFVMGFVRMDPVN